MKLRKMQLRKHYPEAVVACYARLREEYAYRITLKSIGNHYYVYKQESSWDEEKKKYNTKDAIYLGKITNDGAFIPKGISRGDDLEAAKAVIISHGGRVILPSKYEGSISSFEGVELSEVDLKILTNLTMNARMPMTFLSKKVGIKPEGLFNRVKGLEKRLGIQYLPYIRATRLGYYWFAVLIKFKSGHPDPNRLKAELEENPRVQLAAFLSGTYEMIIIALAKNDEDAAILSKTLKGLKSLRNIDLEWYMSFFYITRSVVPIRPEFYEALKGDVWVRTKEAPRPLQEQLTKSEYLLLKELSSNGMKSFRDIERSAGIAAGSARYIYDRLKKKDILRNITLSINGIKPKYFAILKLNVINEGLIQETRKALLEYEMQERSNYITNRFALIGDISIPSGVLLVMPIYNDGDLTKAQTELEGIAKGISVEVLIVTNVLVGSLFLNRFDPLYTIQYESLVEQYKVPYQQREEYEETNRKEEIEI
ncbi:MAG: hypothetical protein ACP5MZ_00950 [Candidatus Micrarchaeia archaeon]